MSEPKTYNLSQSFANLRPSAVREILKSTAGTDIIPFSAGNPSVATFPTQDIARITNDITKLPPEKFLQYGISEGYEPLRTLLSDILTQKGIKKEDDDVILVSGAQQGIDLTCGVLCDPGDVVLCEDPSFIGALNAFRSRGAKLLGLPSDDDGIDPARLEQAITENKRTKFFYIIPNFQNPTGISTSAEKRAAIYEIASRNGIVILEDDPYGELRFEGEPIPSIKSMDKDGSVVYVGSFSKLLAPGLRVGYLLANKALLAKITVAKQCSDVHTPLINQLLVHGFLTTCDLPGHIEKIRAIYGAKYRLMRDSLAQQVPDYVRFTRPQGGLFVLANLPDGADVTAFCKSCISKGLAVVPGSAFAADPDAKSSTVRLNFSTPTDDQITKGCRIFGEAVREMFG